MQDQQTTLATEISIVKVDTCPSLSGRSQLSYQIAKGTSGDIHFRITQNTGSGQFNADWISLDDIEAIISTIPPRERCHLRRCCRYTEARAAIAQPSSSPR